MKRKSTSVLFLLFCVLWVSGQVVVSPSGYIKHTFKDSDGKLIDEIIVPGKPPDYRMPAAVPTRAAVMLTNVPAYDWSFGCSATSAAMMAGFYDRTYDANIYTGPANGGVAPLDNSVWGSVNIGGEVRKQCPLSATRNGVDGRAIKGHVDDFWVLYGSSSPDPYIGNWTMHTYGECTGDYMGTNQSALANTDGSTTFYNYTNGSPLYDYEAGPGHKDGCRGMRQFFESRGCAVNFNYSQYIYGYNGNTLGFTFSQYMQEIDAGRPVMIQVAGHSMLGIGYDAATNLVYLHDTWDYSTHSMVWGGSYSGMQHYGVTVLALGSTTPTIVVSPLSMEQELQSQAMAARSMKIYNTGTAPLNFNIETVYPTPKATLQGNGYAGQNTGLGQTVTATEGWLSVVPDEGTVEAGDSIEIAVIIDATGLNPGQYEGLISVTSNDPIHSTVDVSVTLTVQPAGPFPLNEDWSSGDIIQNQWNFNPSQGNWMVQGSYGNEPPAIYFYWDPSYTNYDFSLVSRAIDATGINDNITLVYDLFLSSYSSETLENLAAEVWDGTAWRLVRIHDNSNGDIGWTTFRADLSSYTLNRCFNVRFRVYGETTFNINYWVIDNIRVVRKVLNADPSSLEVNLAVGEHSSTSFNLINEGATPVSWVGFVGEGGGSKAKVARNPLTPPGTRPPKPILFPETIAKPMVPTLVGVPRIPDGNPSRAAVSGYHIYYDQTGQRSSQGGIASQMFTDLPAYQCLAADDFIVPEGATWDINHVFVEGTFANGGYVVPTVDVHFFLDLEGYPGPGIASFSGIPALSTPDGDVDIDLPDDVHLSGGHYWMTVAAVMDFSTHGQWYWLREQAPTLLNEFAWENPGGGFGSCTTWCYGSSALDGPDYNLGFRLSKYWLTIHPQLGEIPVLNNQSVTVNIDAAQLAEGVYNAFILLEGGPEVYRDTAFITLNVGAVPENLDISDTDIPEAASFCYSARQTITVAGRGNHFIIQNGGSATMVAGQNIRYLPGTRVLEGGYLYGYITTTEQYCGSNMPSIPALPLAGEEKAISAETSSFVLYPNPTTGQLMIRSTVLNGNGKTVITLYSMMGEMIQQESLTGNLQKVTALESKADGIYLLRITTGEKSETYKIIKTH